MSYMASFILKFVDETQNPAQGAVFGNFSICLKDLVGGKGWGGLGEHKSLLTEQLAAGILLFQVPPV